MAIDITTGCFHGSSWNWLAFKEANAVAGVQAILSKITDGTRSAQKVIIEKVILSCMSGHIHLYDGSGRAVPSFVLNADNTLAALTQSWDFQGNPIELTNTDGTGLCISAVGTISGFVKYGWGT